jgi:uncharacterized membrane protein
MGKNRLEAFSDGVIAIIITIMVLELKVPQGHALTDLAAVGPVFAGYVMSFVYLGIYWNNHHHLFHAVHRVSASTLWANMALLFFLSLIPFTTAWMGESHFARVPVVVYGVSVLLPALSYSVLVRALIATHGKDSKIARAIGDDRKGYVSLALYVLGTVLAAFTAPMLGVLCYAIVSCIWIVPDRRIERVLNGGES